MADGRSDREVDGDFDREFEGDFDRGFEGESRADRARSLDQTGRSHLGDVSADDRARAEALRRTVLRKTMRRERARRRGDESPWAWLGTFGLVGWTVVVPTLLGVAAGIFVDDRVDSSVSFTITFLIVGAAVGLSMAWHWVRRESESEEM